MPCSVFDCVQQSTRGAVHPDAVADSIGNVDEATRLVYGQAKGNKTHIGYQYFSVDDVARWTESQRSIEVRAVQIASVIKGRTEAGFAQFSRAIEISGEMAEWHPMSANITRV